MNAYVVKVKSWEEVKKLAKENGVSMHGGNLKNRGKWGEYIKVSRQDKDGSYWYYGVKYYPWMLSHVCADDVLTHDTILKEDTIPINKDGVENIIIKIVEFCNTIFYYKEHVCNNSTFTGYRPFSCLEIISDN